MLPFNYEGATDSAGLYKGGFLARIHTDYDSEWSELTLGQVLLALYEHPNCEGAFLINNRNIMLVGQGFYGLCHGTKFQQEDEKWAYSSMEGCGFTWHPIHHVGYIKTKPIRRDLPCLPWHLFVDEQGRTSFDYRTVVSLPGVVRTAPAPSLYKELIESGADYVYMTADGPQFKMLGDV